MCDYSPFTKRFHKATNSTAVTMGGTEVKSLSQQLESADYKQMGSGLCAGFLNPIHKSTSSRTPAKLSYILCRAKLADSSRGEHAVRKRGNYPIKMSLKQQRVLLNPLPCPQERGPGEASHKPHEAEQMDGIPALKNGGHGDTQGATEGEQLDGEGGPQRCLLHDSDTQGPSTLSEVYSTSSHAYLSVYYVHHGHSPK